VTRREFGELLAAGGVAVVAAWLGRVAKPRPLDPRPPVETHTGPVEKHPSSSPEVEVLAVPSPTPLEGTHPPRYGSVCGRRYLLKEGEHTPSIACGMARLPPQSKHFVAHVVKHRAQRN
jgi:hypothetical protein